MKPHALTDWLLHFAGGALGAALWSGGVNAFVWPAWLVWAAVPLMLAVGTWREWTQHWEDTPVWTGHRVSEALAWGLGALAACGVVAYTLGVIAAVR